MTDLTAIKKNIQVEETQYKSSVSESTMQKIGSSLNWVNQNSVHVLGEIKQSMLTVAQFQAEIGTTWVLCNGQSATGSDYEALTGNSVVPDMRGTVPRMKDNGRGLNPDGDLALGSYQGDTYLNHNHGERTGTTAGTASAEAWTPDSSPTGIISDATKGPIKALIGTANRIFSRLYTDAVGGNETRAKSTTINYFIKINRTVL